VAQTLVSILIHAVFSTKNRTDAITPEVEPELHAYMGGILKHLDSPCLAINGTANHVHLLISQSKNSPLSEVMAELKKSSSKWIKTKGEKFKSFAWQEGYAAFSIGQSNVQALKDYIARQKEHHRKTTFQDELIAILRKYRVPYDERYIWT
jgi:putative transposase